MKISLLCLLVCFMAVSWPYPARAADEIGEGDSSLVAQNINRAGPEGLPSQPEAVKVLAALQALEPPTILFPGEIAELRGASDVTFRWTAVPGAAGYHIVLAKDRSFRTVVYENTKVSDTSYKVENLDYGTYFFRIASIAADGSEGPFSDRLSFIIAPHPPAPSRAK